jgi:hypothetical protein
VALLISLVALLRLFSERLPPLSDSPADLTDPDQVVIDEQRLFAQSAAEDELPDPPQPETRATATAKGMSVSRTVPAWCPEQPRTSPSPDEAI